MIPNGSTPMPGTYFRMIMRELASPDDRIHDALDEISVVQQLRQVENLNRSQPAGWGLRVGTMFDAPAHGPVGVAAATAATIADAVWVLGRYGHLRTPFLTYQSQRDQKGAQLRITDTWGMPDSLRIPLIESTLVSVANLLSRLSGLPGGQLQAEVDYPTPTHVELYRRELSARMTFGCAHTRLRVPDHWLDVRPPSADARLHTATTLLLDAEPEPALEQHALVEAVERLLAAGNVSIAAVADRLYVTPRTLERKLRRLGTTFRQICEQHRRQRAHDLLVNSSLPIAVIAERLGYSDSANFGRACRRWFHTSPSRHRYRL